MYKHILVPTDGSRLSSRAVVHALKLATAFKAKLTAIYVAPIYPLPMFTEGMVYAPPSHREYEEAAAKEARKVLDPVERKAKEAGVDCSTVHAIAEAPWEAILAAAKKHKADAIVMASHGRRGLASLLLGSETQRVLTHTKLPVVVVH